MFETSDQVVSVSECEILEPKLVPQSRVGVISWNCFVFKTQVWSGQVVSVSECENLGTGPKWCWSWIVEIFGTVFFETYVWSDQVVSVSECENLELNPQPRIEEFFGTVFPLKHMSGLTRWFQSQNVKIQNQC